MVLSDQATSNKLSAEVLEYKFVVVCLVWPRDMRVCSWLFVLAFVFFMWVNWVLELVQNASRDNKKNKIAASYLLLALRNDRELGKFSAYGGFLPNINLVFFFFFFCLRNLKMQSNSPSRLPRPSNYLKRLLEYLKTRLKSYFLKIKKKLFKIIFFNVFKLLC